MSVLCSSVGSVDSTALVLHLERLVLGRAGSRIRDLRVEVSPGCVTLHGRANTYYAKQLATHAALNEVAPRALNNAIDVV